ncbi:MAG: diguanylate cyclase [Bryobacterales bacterium]|nr:diguanylate cyclase [Bryobacterales bacterium]
MELGSLEVQIFVSLVVVLGTAFIALVCDFLKGNNEQLRERNVELRTRQDERDRLGLGQPLHWLQGLASLVTGKHGSAPAPAAQDQRAGSPATSTTASPLTAQAASAAPVAGAFDTSVAAPAATLPFDLPAPVPSSEPQTELDPPMRRRAYDEVRPPAPTPSWASKEELEQLAGRAARIRARHESTKTEQEAVIENIIRDIKGRADSPATPEPAPAAAGPGTPAESSVKIRIVPIKAPLETTPETTSETTEQSEPVVASEIAVESASDVVAPPVSAAPVAQQEPAFTEAAAHTDALFTALLPDTPESLPYFHSSLLPSPASSGQEPYSLQPPSLPPLPEIPPVIEQIAPQHPIAPVVAEPLTVDNNEPLPVENSELVAEAPNLPAGLQTAPVLANLLETNDPFTGVVVSIGINDFDALKERFASQEGEEARESINRLIESMLRPSDFASPFQEDDFVLLCAGEVGSAAQRRLFQVSEKLWDYQLRSLGHLTVMFSWGGVEVTNEPLSSAVAAARERMYQTRRNRRPSMDRRRVVNG